MGWRLSTVRRDRGTADSQQTGVSKRDSEMRKAKFEGSRETSDGYLQWWSGDAFISVRKDSDFARASAPPRRADPETPVEMEP